MDVDHNLVREVPRQHLDRELAGDEVDQPAAADADAVAHQLHRNVDGERVAAHDPDEVNVNELPCQRVDL